MKKIGLLGGMSWESTVLYYQAINRAVARELGGLHSARCVLSSIDFAELAAMQKAGDWDAAASLLCGEAQALEKAGAEALLICANTMHRVAPQVAQAVSIPLLHIADATGKAITARGLRRVALLGTAYTMEQPFYREHLAEKYDLDVMIPETSQRTELHRIIYEELCQGRIEAASKRFVYQLVDDLAKAGAHGVILGCTEIPMLLSQADTELPLFDTTELHARMAVAFALAS